MSLKKIGIKHGNRSGSEETKDRSRRVKILKEARSIFNRFGYRKTTIEDISGACRLGKASLYHYFSSKEEIFAEVMRAEYESELDRVRAAVRKTDDPKAQLVAMIKTRFKVVADIIEELTDKSIVSELPELLPLASKVRQQFFHEEVGILQQILEEGQKQGIFREVKSPSVPIFIISALRGIQLHFVEMQDAPSPEEGVEAMMDLFFKGLCL